MTLNPRRGRFDKNPWKSLDLTTITNQTIEKVHVFGRSSRRNIGPLRNA